jgi:hypothetical protein
LPRQPRPPSAQRSLSEDERRKRTFSCAGKELNLSISHLLAEASGDTRPQAALKSLHHSASLSRRRYRPTAPSGIGKGTQISSNDRGARTVVRGPQQSSPRSITMKTSLPWTVESGYRQVGTSQRSAMDRAHNKQCLASFNPRTARTDWCTNAGISLENCHFPPLLKDSRRAFQVAILARHVVAATGDRT